MQAVWLTNPEEGNEREGEPQLAFYVIVPAGREGRPIAFPRQYFRGGVSVYGVL